MNNPPISVTAHSGIDSQNPQSSIASIMLCGNAVEDELAIPEAVIILEITPCTMTISLSINSRP